MQSKHPVLRAGRRKQRGSAMVESALCFSALIFLLIGVMDFGFAVFAYNTCAWAANSGARWAAVHGTNSATVATTDSVQTMVRNQVVGLVKSNVTVTTTWLPDKKPGSTVQVQVSYSLPPLTKLLMKSNLSLSSTSKVVITN